MFIVFVNAAVVLLQMVAETPKLAEYQAYIDFELKEGDPARIQITFERALSENCLVPDMWAKYTTYLVSCWSHTHTHTPRLMYKTLLFISFFFQTVLTIFNYFSFCDRQDRQLKFKDLVLSTHERAVRNCPWTMGLWKSYLLALERHGADHQTVSGKNTSTARSCSHKSARCFQY